MTSRRPLNGGECLLEVGDEHRGSGPAAPLLKDNFGGERRKAKVTSACALHKWLVCSSSKHTFRGCLLSAFGEVQAVPACETCM